MRAPKEGQPFRARGHTRTRRRGPARKCLGNLCLPWLRTPREEVRWIWPREAARTPRRNPPADPPKGGGRASRGRATVGGAREARAVLGRRPRPRGSSRGWPRRGVGAEGAWAGAALDRRHRPGRSREVARAPRVRHLHGLWSSRCRPQHGLRSVARWLAGRLAGRDSATSTAVGRREATFEADAPCGAARSHPVRRSRPLRRVARSRRGCARWAREVVLSTFPPAESAHDGVVNLSGGVRRTRDEQSSGAYCR